MQFRVLGPLEVIDDAGNPVTPRSGRQRAVLGVLLCHRNRPVGKDRLIDLIWPAGAPSSAAANLQTYVHRLRQLIGDDRIVHRAGGYLIQTEQDEVDLDRFDTLLAEGDAARLRGELDAASASLTDALDLWRGMPYDGLEDIDVLVRAAAELQERRLTALEVRGEVGLELSRHERLIPQLTTMVEEHPLREKFRAQLMLALYRGGRTADALATYRQGRALLIEELGIEPGAELRDLHQRILDGDPTLLKTTSMPARAPIPSGLPAVAVPFVGRAAELDELDLALAAWDAGEHTAKVTVVTGPGGVGKTALVLQWAHGRREQFPDGQLYLDLQGYSPRTPLTPAAALDSLLRALGMPGSAIPQTVADRAAAYRSQLAERRAVVVLDNAHDAEQVRPLLPGGPGCVVVVTSRSSLAGLVVRDGAHRLNLDVLSENEAVTLLRRTLGPGRTTDAEAAALTTLVDRLPLAVRIVAERAARGPGMPVARLLSELGGRISRLELVDSGDDASTSISGVLSWSYDGLRPPAACLFRLLGLHPVQTVSSEAAANLVATPLADTRRLLEELADLHLVQRSTADRYQMHDLTASYSAALAQADDSAADRTAALTRLYDHYLHVTTEAMALVDPRRPNSDWPRPRPVVAGAAFADADQARDWLDMERPALVAAVLQAGRDGHAEFAWRLPDVIWPWFHLKGRLDDWIATHRVAVDAAQQLGNHAAAAHALTSLGCAHWTLASDYPEAARVLRQAVDLFGEVSEPAGLARALGNLGNVEGRLGNYPSAIDHYQRALTAARAAGNESFEGMILSNLGCALEYVGRFAEAREAHERAAALAERTGDLDASAQALGNLGVVLSRLGEFASARRHHEMAVELHRQSGNLVGLGYELDNLGVALRGLDDLEGALANHSEALEVAVEIGNRSLRAEIENHLGETCLARGDRPTAAAHHETALGLAVDLGERQVEAYARWGLARTSPNHAAEEQLTYAAEIFAELGAPEADQVRRELAAATAR